MARFGGGSMGGWEPLLAAHVYLVSLLVFRLLDPDEHHLFGAFLAVVD
jgi:hypothetical protein